jgi:inosine-uridine nucleoside N-ribohydrolase
MRLLVVDTDVGVDDAAALAWLLSQTRYPVQVLGFGTVAGNNSLENVTNNLLTILDAVGRRDLPVAMGATTPLGDSAIRIAASVHGPDRLWGVGREHPHDLGPLPRDVPGLYRDLAAAHPGAILVALGPLTNLALALERHPEAMWRFGRLVLLGGAWRGENVTPVAEFNIWYDAEAAARVLDGGAADRSRHARRLPPVHPGARRPGDRGHAGPGRGPAARPRVPILPGGQGGRESDRGDDAGRGGGEVRAGQDAGSGSIGLVRVITDSSPALGQTIMGFDPWERVSLAVPRAKVSRLAARRHAEPGFDSDAALDAAAARVPDNADVVLEVDPARMRSLFMEALAPG